MLLDLAQMERWSFLHSSVDLSYPPVILHPSCASGSIPTSTDVSLELNTTKLLDFRLNIRGSTLRNRPLDFKIQLSKVNKFVFCAVTSNFSGLFNNKLEPTKEFEAFAMPMFKEGRLKPLVTKIFPWEQTADAHR